MGAVYRARDLHFPNISKLVAVKEMIIQTHDPVVRSTIVRNFEREANLLATLDHPSIPQIYDYFTYNDRSYLVLEFIQGKDLESLLEEQELDEKQVVLWAIQICDVLNYLHNHKPDPIIFRDMKPSNIMINQNNRVILIDYGIAKPFQSGQRGTMIGTEGYSPPEQYRGEATPLVDIYALGAALHHLLTRKDPRLEPPFSFQERPINQIRPDISPELVKIINKALEYNSEERYPDVQEMKTDFLLLAKTTGLLSPGTKQAPMISLKQSDIEPVWVFVCEDEIRGTPTCDREYVFFGSYDRHLYALNNSTGDLKWRYGADAGIVSKPFIADDQVYFGSEDHRLHVVNRLNGRIIWTQYTDGPIRSSPIIAEGHLFIGSDDGNLYAFNINTARKTWQMDSGAPIRSTPLISDNSILFGNEMGDFFCLDFSGSVRWHFKAKRAITSSPVLHDHSLYFTSLDATVYALEVNSGFVNWRFRLAKGSISTPSIDNGRLCVGAADGYIYCLDLLNGQEIWRYPTRHQVSGSPFSYEKAVFVPSVDCHLYCLNQEKGNLIWKFSTQGPITGSPIVKNQMLFFGSTDHRFYAMNIEK